MTKVIRFAMIVIGASWLALAAGPAESSSQPATQASTRPAKELTLDLGNKVTMKLVEIPAGKFLMGSPKNEKDRNRGAESPQHEVTISKPYYIGVCEVTQAQYEQVMGKNPSSRKYRGPTNPAGNMRWSEAVKFCKQLSKKTGKTVRLPSEAEWEYACRAGSTTRFYYGDDNNEEKLGEYAWYGKNSPDKVQAVGQKKPNAWGLYDMHGSVYEWVSDWSAYYTNAKSVVDPTGPEYGKKRSFRGGSVYRNNAASQCRSAYRNSEEGKNMASDCVGFRVVVESQVKNRTEPATPRVAQPSTRPAKKLTLDLGNKVAMKLVEIPAGKFLMGSPKSEKGRNPGAESPQHQVTISKPYYMGVYEVTQAQYEQVMGKNPSTYKGPTNPAGNMPWSDAAKFCKKLSKKTGKRVRLPSEAEWEHACRAGSTTRFYYGDDDGKLDDYAWHGKNGDGKAHAVGQKKPNAFGLYDMHGSVYEWCNDWLGRYTNAKSVVDPTGPVWAGRSGHVIRGGSFYRSCAASQCRSAYRGGEEGKNMRCDPVGFRVVVESQLGTHGGPGR